jgi:DNA-3-methyladenine glycosylase
MGLTDRASHSFGGRRTARNEHMYASGGSSYVYICYGMHQMFNVVTNEKDVPDAVLVRALEPLEGIEIMLKRTSKRNLITPSHADRVTGKALGIHKNLSGLDLRDERLFIADDGFIAKPEDIVVTSGLAWSPPVKMRSC